MSQIPSPVNTDMVLIEDMCLIFEIHLQIEIHLEIDDDDEELKMFLLYDLAASAAIDANSCQYQCLQKHIDNFRAVQFEIVWGIDTFTIKISFQLNVGCQNP